MVGEAFTLTLAAELGDRSQITTVALSAAGSAFGVTVGALIGHAFATGGAVLGGPNGREGAGVGVAQWWRGWGCTMVEGLVWWF